MVVLAARAHGLATIDSSFQDDKSSAESLSAACKSSRELVRLGLSASRPLPARFGPSENLPASAIFRALSSQLGAQGFDGKVFDNPALIDVVNTAYSPDAEDIAWAHRVQAAKAEAPPNGLYFVDGAHCDMAYEALADRILGFVRAMEAREHAGPRL
eukprot:COSAG04_NODE_924_length_9380_cov_8.463312_2_plen_157_part_00